MNNQVVIEGGDEIVRKLQKLGDEMERAQEIILRAAGDVIGRAAADNVRDASATVADNIDVQRIPASGVVVAVGPTKKAWFAHLIEGGARPHEIMAGGKRLRFQWGTATIYRRRVMHPGIGDRPFLKPAAEQKGDDAARAAADKAEDVIRRAT